MHDNNLTATIFGMKLFSSIELIEEEKRRKAWWIQPCDRKLIAFLVLTPITFSQWLCFFEKNMLMQCDMHTFSVVSLLIFYNNWNSYHFLSEVSLETYQPITYFKRMLCHEKFDRVEWNSKAWLWVTSKKKMCITNKKKLKCTKMN